MPTYYNAMDVPQELQDKIRKIATYFEQNPSEVTDNRFKTRMEECVRDFDHLASLKYKEAKAGFDKINLEFLPDYGAGFDGVKLEHLPDSFKYLPDYKSYETRTEIKLAHVSDNLKNLPPTLEGVWNVISSPVYMPESVVVDIEKFANEIANIKVYKTIDPEQFVQNHAESVVYFKKVGSVEARPAIPGERIDTIMKNGHLETSNVAGENQYVIRNPDGEQYIIDAKKFESRYNLNTAELGTDGFSKYQVASGPMKVIRLGKNEDVEFQTPWGETMRINGAGVIVDNGPGDIYGIQAQEFANTYRPCDKDGKLFTHEELSLISKEYATAIDANIIPVKNSGPSLSFLDFTVDNYIETNGLQKLNGLHLQAKKEKGLEF